MVEIERDLCFKGIARPTDVYKINHGPLLTGPFGVTLLPFSDPPSPNAVPSRRLRLV